MHNFYLGEENFISEMNSKVEPYLEKILTKGSFKSYDDTEIAYRFYKLEKPKAYIVISHGFCEFGEKYNEMIYYFSQAGYSVFFIEYRGHGHSARATDNPSKVHVGSYIEYIKDLNFFMKKIVCPISEGKKRFIFGHSMGGCVAALYLEKYPTVFDSAILSSPMLEVSYGKYPSAIAKPTIGYFNLTGRGSKYAFGEHDFDGVYVFEKSSCKSEPRYQYIFQKRLNNIDYQTYGGTFSWVKAGTKASQMAKKRMFTKRIKIPVLIFQAGEDSLVKPGGQEKFAASSENTKIIIVKNSKHEVLNALEDVRVSYYEKIFGFWDELVPLYMD